MGYWLCGGFVWRATEHFNLGVDLRYSDAEADLFDEFADVFGEGIEVSSGGTHIGVLIGYRW
jgi:hypothetical protein